MDIGQAHFQGQSRQFCKAVTVENDQGVIVIVYALFLNFQKLNRWTTISTVNEKTMPALDVFAASIKYFKEDFLDNSKDLFGR